MRLSADVSVPLPEHDQVEKAPSVPIFGLYGSRHSGRFGIYYGQQAMDGSRDGRVFRICNGQGTMVDLGCCPASPP